jgi:RimJ/RimL family protein N-acetyltransferase
MIVPREIHTSRLRLRSWVEADAEALQAVLEANRAHLTPWIPARVVEPAPVEVLTARLAGFAEAFSADREWRYAMLRTTGDAVLGEISLFPRAAAGRVGIDEADRAEIGYWLRVDATGRGLATEAAQAMVDLAATLPRVRHVEIRCDARNAASAAVPRRLGFTLTDTVEVPPVVADADTVALQVWTRPLRRG